LAVKDGIALLKSFPPKNPVQTLLLAPTFIIGCGAVGPKQRGSVRSSIYTIKEYTGLKNTDLALKILEQLGCIRTRRTREVGIGRELHTR
jgi:hypothetical protein